MEIYNKLVRDKIPEIIKSNGEEPITRILNDLEYKEELEKKLYEEYQEVLNSSCKDRIEELADMLEIIKYLAKLENSTLEEVITIAKEKSIKRGAFDNKIFLERVLKKWQFIYNKFGSEDWKLFPQVELNLKKCYTY